MRVRCRRRAASPGIVGPVAVISIQPDPPAGGAEAQGDAIAFVLGLGRALHRCGHRPGPAASRRRPSPGCWSPTRCVAAGAAC